MRIVIRLASALFITGGFFFRGMVLIVLGALLLWLLGALFPFIANAWGLPEKKLYDFVVNSASRVARSTDRPSPTAAPVARSQPPAPPTPQPTATPTRPPVAAQAVPQPPSAPPKAEPPRPSRPAFRSQNPGWVAVANTDGQGVFVRDFSNLARLRAWPDGTVLELIGDDVERDGQLYTPVRDPDGRQGLVPSQYLVAASRPAPRVSAAAQTGAQAVKPQSGVIGTASASDWCRQVHDATVFDNIWSFPQSDGFYCVYGTRDIPVDLNDVCLRAYNNPRALGRRDPDPRSLFAVQCRVP